MLGRPTGVSLFLTLSRLGMRTMRRHGRQPCSRGLKSSAHNDIAATRRSFLTGLMPPTLPLLLLLQMLIFLSS